MYGNPGPFTYSPGGFSQDDFLQQRRGFQQDDFKSSPLQRSNTFRPNGKSIYMQRKEYSDTLNKQADNFHHRVEHLFTCELDGQEVRNLDDCVAKLKRLDAKGRLWAQEMIMEVQGGHLQLSDIETKADLESLPLSCILETKAVLDSCAYNSLLTITVQDRKKRLPQVFMFQCEELGAEHVKSDLDHIVQNRGADEEPRRGQSHIRNDLENIIGLKRLGSFQQPWPRPVQRELTPPPPDPQPPQWNMRESENMPPPRGYTPPEETYQHTEFNGPRNSQEVSPPPEYAEIQRNTDILNHILTDMEIFMDKVSAAANAAAPKEEKNKKKKKKKKSQQKNAAPLINLPPWEEYVSCLQKIKYGFNLLGQLDGALENPSAPDFVHIFFSSLGMMVPLYPADLPPSVLAPLLTEPAVLLLSNVINPQEDQLWRSLGDSWNIPRSRWPDDNIPPYIPDFYDGWQLPPIPARPRHQNGPISRSNSQHFPPGGPHGQMNENQNYSPREMQWQPEEPVVNGAWASPPPTRPSESKVYMRVIYDFMARNSQELSIMKGDVVQVLKKNKQWWLIRNNREEEGHVPQNVLEPMDRAESVGDPQETQNAPPLSMMSTPADVKAWLEYKGFSKITVRSLGVLNGKLLLGMTRDEMRTVCPEEGSKVFFQLQAIKSAIALASESAYGPYNNRY
ncbi:epidermal growth factor receptor kinase substrate 8-like protein 3b [Myripristis murdjan]|uniref:epidermal growth factor receptor kinase substrate 8-like protein 3b n=1 Tax=Myripristis murdjan TaxID=586833 RepID=UPI001175CB3F|nr:epidermal growth factor receptor kinase substrate 8-like protein 3 [Myripristis murdjan]